MRQQEYFRGIIIRRMLGERGFEEFCEEYKKFRAYNIYKQVFIPEVKIERKPRNFWNF